MALIHGFYVLAPAANSAAPTAKAPSQLVTPLIQRDFEDGGLYSFSGTVVISGTPDIPVSRQVLVFCEQSKRVVRSVWSAEDGTFTFENLRAGPWIVMAIDYTNTYDASIAVIITLPLSGSVNIRFGDYGSILSYWNGTQWVSGRLKRWDGSDWVLV